ncbi:4574_t:CDS:2, partial [Acaulospora colombiana]
EGIIHLYRTSPNSGNVEQYVEDGTMLAILAIPSWMNVSDFLTFVSPAYEDALPNRALALIKFRSAQDASDFREEFNGKYFNSMEVRIMIETPDLVTGSFPPPPDGSVELPTCPVCLERMDTAITGLVTVPWSQLPPSRGRSQSSANVGSMTTCRDCSTTTNLWICLICELETQRVWDYAGDAYVHRLIQNRADGKLVELPSASITTGSVTDNSRALGPGPSDTMAAEKIEAIGIEYSYLLTSQLDSQRTFYEEQLETMKEQLSSAFTKLDLQSKEMEVMTAQWQMKEQKWREEVETRQDEAVKERVKLEKKVEKAMDLARKFEKELREERMVNDGLLQNLSAVKKRSEAFEEEKAQFMGRIGELEDQMRDIMAHLEHRERVDKEGGELAGGSIEVKTPPPSSSSSRKKKKK